MSPKHRQHLNLLCDIGDLAGLIIDSSDIQSFLQQAVNLVACHLAADVGSIYLWDEAAQQLVLSATVGLNPEAVGQVKMRPGEGLVGATLQQGHAIREGRASRNPNFKYFEEAHEDRFESFLSVPIVRGPEKIGVLVVQHEASDYFDEIDVMALRAIAAQLAGAIENARLIIHFDRLHSPTEAEDLIKRLHFVKGDGAAAGYALAQSIVLGRHHDLAEFEAGSPDLDNTLAGLQTAVRRTISQLRALQQGLAERLPESASLIFEAHFMILKDQRFLGAMVKKVRQGLAAAEAIRQVAGQFMRRFDESPSAYLREKAQDIEDLARRLLHNLHQEPAEHSGLAEGRIVIAPELFPSDVLKLASENVAGIVLVSGGLTSHVSILARSLHLPLVIAERPELLKVPDGTPILLDADMGSVFVHPSQETVLRFEARNAARSETIEQAPAMRERTETADGVRVHLLANINLLSEVSLAQDLKAEGIGLYRTEFPFLVRTAFPSEEEQYNVYRRIVEALPSGEVTFRTLDVGGEKHLPYLDAAPEANPELGLRAIRFSFHHPDVFSQQLRAILRAARKTDRVRILFPMISSLDDFTQARRMVDAAMIELADQDLAPAKRPLLGVMVETPAMVEIIAEMAAAADFFSIGTNDFIQYLLGVDRNNERVAAYYRPGHPSVLRALQRVVAAARAAEIDVTVCGEMGHDPAFAPFLLGIGLRRFSVDPRYLPILQGLFAGLVLADAQRYAAQLLASPSVAAAQTVVDAWHFADRVPPST